MSFASDIAGALRETQRLLTPIPEEGAGDVPRFTHRGTDYPCTPNLSTETSALEVGGLGMEQGVRIYVLRVDMPTAPAQKDVITYNADRYSVDSIAVSPCGSYFRLDCSRYGRGA